MNTTSFYVESTKSDMLYDKIAAVGRKYTASFKRAFKLLTKEGLIPRYFLIEMLELTKGEQE